MTCFFGTFRWCRIVLGVRLSRDLHMAYSHTKLSTHCIALIYWNNFNIESKTRVERKISNCCSPPKKLSLGQIYINATQLRGIPPPQNAVTNPSVAVHIPQVQYVCYELASISAHFSLISWFFVFEVSRFAFVRSSLCARKHLLTCVFASLHIPIAFHIKPRAWHSSRSVITSSQANIR